MSEEEQTKNDPEKTLLTLDQLSQAIEVMTSVVNRLRRHLREQIEAQVPATENEPDTSAGSGTNALVGDAEVVQDRPVSQLHTRTKESASKGNAIRESFVVEIGPPEDDSETAGTKTLH